MPLVNIMVLSYICWVAIVLIQSCYFLLMAFSALKLMYQKNLENFYELSIFIVASTVDVLLVLFMRARSADYVCILRIVFVVFLK